ncbi:MAG: hypothetical protein QNJ31_00500 [Candidatus Caenarcaniphilales bacterium]|nr:hypothetical protein [Candidatus Caenarcaniphilales bacterium]
MIFTVPKNKIFIFSLLILPLNLLISTSGRGTNDINDKDSSLKSTTFLESQVKQLTSVNKEEKQNLALDGKLDQSLDNPKATLPERTNPPKKKKNKVKRIKRVKRLPRSKKTSTRVKTQDEEEKETSKSIPESNANSDFSPISINNKEQEKNDLKSKNKELQKITADRKKNSQKTIDAMNFIQPSLNLQEEEQKKIDSALTRAEQEQLTILWRATLERNKTIRFIVEKLTPDSQNKKKNQVLSQILNTAIFLPFYALQSVTPADTSALASYVGAGLASDLINGKTRKNSDRLQLSQTEMVIMFMMIDQVAERVRSQFHEYKEEKVDEALAVHELKQAKIEAAAALDTMSPESQFLSQVRIRQIERELRRINIKVRSNRIVLIDLAGQEAVKQVDGLIDKEIAAIIDLPELISASN